MYWLHCVQHDNERYDESSREIVSWYTWTYAPHSRTQMDAVEVGNISLH